MSNSRTKLAPAPAAASPPPRRGHSLHIGLDHVDPAHYAGWAGALMAAENDAIAMERLARSQGYATTIFLGPRATRHNFLSILSALSRSCGSRDRILITRSGHGMQTPDLDGDELDGLDESFCFHDGPLLDDSFHDILVSFPLTTQIHIIDDCCHSGTGFRAAPSTLRPIRRTPAAVVRQMRRMKLHDPPPLDRRFRTRATGPGPAIVYMGACLDHQVALDGLDHGLYTGTLLKVWDQGRFRRNLTDFHDRITAAMPGFQTPSLETSGPAHPLLQSRPFTP